MCSLQESKQWKTSVLKNGPYRGKILLCCNFPPNLSVQKHIVNFLSYKRKYNKCDYTLYASLRHVFNLNPAFSGGHAL